MVAGKRDVDERRTARSIVGTGVDHCTAVEISGVVYKDGVDKLWVAFAFKFSTVQDGASNICCVVCKDSVRGRWIAYARIRGASSAAIVEHRSAAFHGLIAVKRGVFNERTAFAIELTVAIDRTSIVGRVACKVDVCKARIATISAPGSIAVEAAAFAVSSGAIGLSGGNGYPVEHSVVGERSGVGAVEEKHMIAVIATDVVGVFGNSIGIGVVASVDVAREDGNVFGQVAVIELIDHIVGIAKRLGAVPAAVDLEAVLIAGNFEPIVAAGAGRVHPLCNNDYVVSGSLIEGVL